MQDNNITGKDALPVEKELPPISVVIIGINVENYIGECISSVLHADYPQASLEIIYVDGGSNDSSIGIAKTFPGVRIIELQDSHPTPGKGRNAGITRADHSFIQLLDADTILHPGWLRTALPYLKSDVAAVAGRIQEKHPGKNLYHVIGNMEWGISAGKEGHIFAEGPSATFGGIVLARKDAIMEVNGYDESLIAGEDPDLSYRVRRQGWTIYRITADMVVHDLNMNTFRHYCKRAFRSGHAYAEIGLRYRKEKEKFFLRQLLRICLGATVPAAVIFFGLLMKRWGFALFFATAIAFRPFRKINHFAVPPLGIRGAILYCSHLSFVVYPQFFGVLRYFATSITGMPLQNKGYDPHALRVDPDDTKKDRWKSLSRRKIKTL
jgi:glycosyltransferase involved in cell wall biosynthesis